MSDAEKMRIISSAYHKFCDIYDDADLHKAGLSLSDYREVEYLFSLLGKPGSKAKTLISNAAKWFANKGYTVELKGIAFEITI